MKLKIEKVVSGGEGLGFDSDSAVFAPGTLPGELWAVEVTEKKKGFKRVRGLELLEGAHPDRVSPLCPHYQNCGGCDFQHVNHHGQIEAKIKIIEESFRRIGKMTPPEIQAHTGQEWGYRSRIQLHFDGNHWGFKARTSDRIVTISQCPVSSPGINLFLASDPTLWPKENGRFTVFGDDVNFQIESPGRTISIKILGKTLEFSLEGFFQSNLQMTEKLISIMQGYFKKASKALDLYAGSGLFGVFLEEQYDSVLSVEENPKATLLGKRNLKKSGHSFTTAPVEQWIQGLLGPFYSDVIVVDPPRTGLSNEVRDFLGNVISQQLLYVSCNPDTLARDAGDLVRKGWVLKDFHFFDFYPQTTHIESLCVFEKNL